MGLIKVKHCIPYYPTPMNVVDKMIEVASLKPGDKLIDLGSGDARIPIRAAQIYDDIKCHGVEINPVLVSSSMKKIKKLNLEGRVNIFRGDLFKIDLSRFNVITLYLTPEALSILSRKLTARKLALETRIISHNYPIQDFHPDICEKISVNGKIHRLYVYTLKKNLEMIPSCSK